MSWQTVEVGLDDPFVFAKSSIHEGEVASLAAVWVPHHGWLGSGTWLVCLLRRDRLKKQEPGNSPGSCFCVL